MAYHLNQVEVHSRITVNTETWYDENGDRLPELVTRLIETTVGRVLFNRILIPEIRYVNKTMRNNFV